MAITTHIDLDDLRASVDGDVFAAGDDGWDDARRPWNITIDQRPAAVVYPAHAADVAATVRFAAGSGLRVAAQGTGHNAAPMGDLADTILVRTSNMRGVTVDAERRRVRVEAGALWMDVLPHVPEGLAALSGSSPDVGVVGYSLGGGISWMARRFGMQTNQIVAADVVTADGVVVRYDEDTDPDMLWALRGGGGNFGVVTALEFMLQEVAEITAGMMVWDVSQAERVLRAFNDWAPGAPEEITTSFRLMSVPDAPEMPEPLRGRQIVVIDGAVTASPEQADEILRPLRDLEPEMDLFGPMPAAGLVYIHQDPEGPTPVVSDHAMLARLDSAGVDAFLAMARERLGAVGMIELRQLGGALARRAGRPSAMPVMDGAYALFTGQFAPDADAAAAGLAASHAVIAAMKPWHNGRNYLNFAENRVDPATGYRAEDYARLRVARRAVDPAGVFRANHEIG